MCNQQEKHIFVFFLKNWRGASKKTHTHTPISDPFLEVHSPVANPEEPGALGFALATPKPGLNRIISAGFLPKTPGDAPVVIPSLGIGRVLPDSQSEEAPRS